MSALVPLAAPLPVGPTALADPRPAPPAAPLPDVVAPPAPGVGRMYRSDAFRYFHAVSYFEQRFGQTPWCRVFTLAEKPPHADLIAALAARFHHALKRAAVAHVEFHYAADEPADYPHTTFVLGPHLLLELTDEQLFRRGSRSLNTATLYHSPAADPATLADVTALLLPRLAVEPSNAEVLYVLRKDAHVGTDFYPVSFKQPAVDLAAHYNDDLPPVHAALLARLRAPDDKGLVLLHGPPGTGKTTYLRHLAALLPGKRKLFVPPHLASQLTSPDFMGLLTECPNAVLIIEDAERLLLRRDQTDADAGAISSLLNLTDGFLADVLRIQIVCTFNTALARLDPALLRKGRLIASYHFGPLALPKTRALAATVGWPNVPAEALTLAEIFNREDADFNAVPEVPVGFVKGRAG